MLARANPETSSPGVCWSGEADGIGLGLVSTIEGVALIDADGDEVGEGEAVGDGVDRGEAEGEGVVVGDGAIDGVGVGAIQRGSIVKRATRCSTKPSRWVTRQYIAYLPGASSGIPLR